MCVWIWKKKKKLFLLHDHVARIEKKKPKIFFLSTDVYKKLTLWGLAGLTIYPDSALIYLYLIRIIESDDDQTRPEI
jgi:hypothetical protein